MTINIDEYLNNSVVHNLNKQFASILQPTKNITQGEALNITYNDAFLEIEIGDHDNDDNVTLGISFKLNQDNFIFIDYAKNNQYIFLSHFDIFIDSKIDSRAFEYMDMLKQYKNKRTVLFFSCNGDAVTKDEIVKKVKQTID